MAESVKEVKIKYFKHEFYCDECLCDLGESIGCLPTGYSRDSYEYYNRKDYEHDCPKCESSFWLSKIYPYTEARECEF
jgi:Zn finger protein HypA/HybF involved in hydrogenase expression